MNRGTYTGQAGPVYIEPSNNLGAYDREIFPVIKEFAPAFSRGGDMEMDMLARCSGRGPATDREGRRRAVDPQWRSFFDGHDETDLHGASGAPLPAEIPQRQVHMDFGFMALLQYP